MFDACKAKRIASWRFAGIIFFVMNQPLSRVYELHIESSDSCNLHCKYCYFVAKKTRKTEFSIDRFSELLAAFFQYTDSNVNLAFHGGEPLMNDAEWFDEASTIAEEIARKHHKNITFHLQTNGSLLTEEHVRVLKKHQFDVNVSLDGPEDIHNEARGLYARTVRAIKLLQEAGIFMGSITVIGKHNYNKIEQVVDELLRLGVKRYHFNVGSIVSQDAAQILTAEEILQYYKDSLNVFLDTYQEACNWVLLGKLRRYVSGQIPQFACDSPICGAGIFKIHMLSNGDFYPCGSCVNTQTGIETLKLGNIFQTLDKEDYQKTLLKFQTPYFETRSRCENCPAAIVCDFVCPAFDILDKVTFENKCISNRQFVEYLKTLDQTRIQQVVSYYGNCDE